MARFIVRRVMAMAVVLILISILTFVMFEAIPNGDPALRLAGRLATQTRSTRSASSTASTSRSTFSMRDDEEHLHRPGLLLHPGLQRARRDQGRPAGDGVAGAGGGHLLVIGLDRCGHARGLKAGKYTDKLLTVLAMTGVSFPPFFLGAVLIYFLGYKANIFPLGGYVS